MSTCSLFLRAFLLLPAFVAPAGCDVRSPAPQQPGASDPVGPHEQGEDLHDAVLLGLIQNARVAALRGDETTRRAMLIGLRREALRARELILWEQERAVDFGESVQLGRLLADLGSPEEAR